MSVIDYCKNTFGKNATTVHSTDKNCSIKLFMKEKNPQISLADFTKSITPDGNMLYTVTYGGMILQPDLTQILCDTQGDILAYIDIEQLPELKQKFNAQFKTLWFGIQEWHPNLIGDFKKELSQYYIDELNFLHCAVHPGYWEHNSEKHLYTFTRYSSFAMENGMDWPTDWFHVKTDHEQDGQIETNFHIFDKKNTRTYKYYTHPLVPTDKIKQLTQKVLLADGVITHHGIRKQNFKNVKRTVGHILSNALTNNKK